MLKILFCALIGLVAMGCTTDAQSRFLGNPTLAEMEAKVAERNGRRTTMEMLQASYRTCLTTGETNDVCRRDLLAYRACLDSEQTDAQCRAELFE